ncbi:MAG TPA: response regulator [Chloroflexia bacterium]|nr:response regulator [Chloroflexia bacterium]
MSGGRRRILVVDDDFFISDMLTDDLTARGYQVTVAANARMLGRLMEQYPPDLILLDLMLPGMEGIEIGHLLRVNPLTAPIPVLVVSADRRIAQKAATFGAQGWVAKPFDLDVLATEIARLLEAPA